MQRQLPIAGSHLKTKTKVAANYKCQLLKYWKDIIIFVNFIVPQSAPYGAPGLRKRNLGAPRAIRLLVKIFKEISCGAP